MAIRSQVNRLSGDRWRSQDAAVELIGCQGLEPSAGCKDGRHTLFIGNVDLPIGKNGRRGKVAFQPRAPVELPGSGIETTGDAVVADQIQFLIDQQG